MYIELFGSSDRLGGNIVDMISQFIFAVQNNMYIKYNREFIRVYNSYNQNYNNSIFMQTIFDMIDLHNSKMSIDNLKNKVELSAPSHFEVLSRTTLSIRQDMFSFFREKLFSNEIKNIFLDKSLKLKYEIPFDPDNTILIHHRLEDVKDRFDYDGTPCVNLMRNIIESDKIPNNSVLSLVEPNPKCHLQSPLSTKKILNKIDEIKKYKPNHEVIILSTPNENLSEIPYKYISSNDEFYDLFLLCSCKTLILSRSNYALSSLFFGVGEDIHLPLWGHLPCYGLTTKFDKTNFNYFI